MINEAKKEGSTVAASLKGVSAPFGSKIIRKKKKGDNNVSKPYGEPELFEALAAFAALSGQSIEEVVKKVGNQWAVIHDKTGAKVGSYKEREVAWEKQRLLRKQDADRRRAKKKDAKKAPTPKSNATAKTAPKSKKAPKPKVSKEQLMNTIKATLSSVLKEGSMLSYVFEQNPTSEDTLGWENFTSHLTKETVMSDQGLKGILQNVANSEAKTLVDAIKSIKKVLEGSGKFEVEVKGADQDEATGDIVMNFHVKMQEGGKKLPFAVKIENGRPLLVFPEESRQQLNTMATEDSKYLRAEMMHVQETMLDNMLDIVNATQERDDYLKNVAEEVSDTLSNMGPLRVAMLKYLLKNKYRTKRTQK